LHTQPLYALHNGHNNGPEVDGAFSRALMERISRTGNAAAAAESTPPSSNKLPPS
jgi:hypothetical protein